MTSQHSTALGCPHLSSALTYRSNSRPVSRRSRHGLYAASQQQQQQLVATEDSQRQHGDESLLASSTTSPWCVILPNGKQFQLRELCSRSGRQSVWGCEAAALLSTAEPVLVDQPPDVGNLSTHHSQPPQQHTTGSLPALQHQEEQQAAQQHPWSQQWQDAFQREQQQLRPLSAYHMKRLRWQQQQLHQQVLRQQQQQQQEQLHQQAHLQQELEDFSQRAASLHQPTGVVADRHVMLQSLVPGHEAEAVEAAAGTTAADAIQQLHLSTAQVPSPWAAAAPAVEGTAADAEAIVKDSPYVVDTLRGTVPAAPAALLLQPQSTEQASDAGSAALGLPGSTGTTGPTAAAAAAAATAAMSVGESSAAGEAADHEGLYSAAGGLQDDALTPPGLYASTLQLPLSVHGEEMLAWSFAEVETAGAAAAAATAGLSAPAAAGAAREQVHGSAAAPGTGQPAAARVPVLPTAQAAGAAAADDAGAAALQAAAVAEIQALFTEQLQHQLELRSAPPKPAAAAAALGAAAPTATTAADASFATSGAADMLSWSLSEASSTTEPVPAADSITSKADPAAVTTDGRAAAQSPDVVSTQQQQQPAAAAGLAGKPLVAEQLLGVQSVLLKEQQQQTVEQGPAEAQQHASTADVATLSVLQPSVVQLRPAASERQQQQAAQGPASPAVSSGAHKLLRQIDQSRTCWELGLLVMQHTSYAPGLNSSKALHVNLEDWTPDVVAAALERFRKLASYTLVAHLRNKEARQQQHQLRQHHPSPLGSLQGNLNSPGTSSSSSRRQDGAGGDDAEVQPHLTSSQHIKTLMRVLLRLMDMLELQLTEVPSRALREAAVCSANLLGRSCTQSTWWRRARGYMVLGEAALRLKEGRMPVSCAIQVCYSYSHCDYPPTQLLQVLMQQVQDRPGVLEQQTLTTLCRFTYCVTRHRPQLTGFDQGALTAAVLQALPLQNLAAAGLAESVEAMTGRMYDLVMLLRHVCQLNFKPPAGVLGLMPALMTGMASMTMQELCTVLHIAVAWDLPQKQELAAAAAEAAISAAGLQQQQQAQSSAATGGSLHPISSSIRLPATTEEPSGPVARTAADAVLLLHRFCCLGYQPPEPLTQHLLGFIAPKLHELSLLQAELLRRPLVHIWRSPAYCQQLVQACFTQWMGPKQHVSTSSSITDHGSGNGTSSSHVSTGTLHARLAQQAHVGGDTAEQQYVLQPALLRLPHCQLKALLVASGRFGLLASEMREQQRHEDWQLQEQLHHQHEQQEEQLGQQARHDALRQQLQEALSGSPVPQQEHAAMITAVQPAQQTPATGSASQAAGCTSSLSTRKGLEHSCEPVGDSCHSMAAAFITTVLNEITPAVLAGWRADLVLALLWSAARLKVQVSQQLLQAGAAVMRAGLRQQIAARELVLLMWTAAALKMNDPGFLEGLCGRLAHCANQLAPSSIASAAWALVELRCPHSVLLGVLSRELLRPLPWLSSHQAFKIRKWHARRPPSRQQQRHLQQQLLLWAVQHEAAAAFNSRYSDAAAWGSVQRPMPRSKEQLGQHRQPAAAAPTKRRPPRRGRWRAARRSSTASRMSYQATSPQSLSLSPAAAGVLGYVHQQHLLDVHPRVRQLGAADVAKLVCSCCRAGWAPPHLFAVLAVRLVELMPQMDPATLVQVMWAYSTAGCCDGGLLQGAARRAASLASRHAFDSSRQLLSLLASFRAMGLLKSDAQAVLQELERLQVAESLQAV